MGRRILVVEDEADITLFIRIGLQHAGYDVDAASTGEEAVELLGSKTYDALVLDLRLPGMDGWEVLDRLKALAPELPVIVASAHASPASAERAKAAGCAGYVTKPFRISELAQTLAAVTG